MPPFATDKPTVFEIPVEMVQRSDSLNVLVVDDDENIGRALKRVIQGIGKGRFLVEALLSPLPAIEKIKSGNIPDVIFSDMIMPEMDGRGFYDWIVKEFPDLRDRFFIVTGNSGSPDYQEFFGNLKNRVIEKPFERGDIQKALKSAIESGKGLASMP
jgi:CheY-like chemotaxis protein